MSDGDKVRPFEFGRYLVPSSDPKGAAKHPDRAEQYLVETFCSCKGFEVRKWCRHLEAVRAYLKDQNDGAPRIQTEAQEGSVDGSVPGADPPGSESSHGTEASPETDPEGVEEEPEEF